MSKHIATRYRTLVVNFRLIFSQIQISLNGTNLFGGIKSLNVYNLATGVPLTGYSGYDWLMFALLAFFPTIAHVIYNYLLNYVNAATVSMSTLGEPVGATILAVLFLHEQLLVTQLIGGVIVMVGIFWFLRLKCQEEIES